MRSGWLQKLVVSAAIVLIVGLSLHLQAKGAPSIHPTPVATAPSTTDAINVALEAYIKIRSVEFEGPVWVQFGFSPNKEALAPRLAGLAVFEKGNSRNSIMIVKAELKGTTGQGTGWETHTIEITCQDDLSSSRSHVLTVSFRPRGWEVISFKRGSAT